MCGNAPNMGAAPGLVFHERGFAVPQVRHELGVVPSFQFVRHQVHANHPRSMSNEKFEKASTNRHRE